ncbi:UNVERIFIED_CONTAM: hypothetical protein FKN15_059283 [Acipenser sinensis]
MGTHMWNNAPARRGRRLSVENPMALLGGDAMKFTEIFQKDLAGRAVNVDPSFWNQYAAAITNGLAMKNNEISVIQNGGIPQHPIILGGGGIPSLNSFTSGMDRARTGNSSPMTGFDKTSVDTGANRPFSRGTHTANNIYRTYEETTEVYNMADNVSGIVTDNAANMVKTFTIFPPWDVQDSDKDQDEADIEVASVRDKLDYFSPKRSPCFVHMLQLVVCDALEQAGPLRQVMAKVCRIVSYCHKYTKATE